MDEKPKPSLKDLEAIIDREGDEAIEILPNGEVRYRESKRPAVILPTQALPTSY